MNEEKKELTFEERKIAFGKELNELLEKYKLALGVYLIPANKFSKIFKKWLVVQWNLIVKDNGVQQSKNLSSKPTNKQ